tara:strand:- start:58 stop:507 length:450 start_codon:yes stop_codon:yes gene_type:complete
MLKKITVGFVIQNFDPKTRKFVSQEFVAGDQVNYEDENGEEVDDDLFCHEVPGQNFMPEVYLPFNMVQPEPSGFEINIVVEAMGHFNQTIIVTDPDWSPNNIIASLHEGRLATTIQEGGELHDLVTGASVGKVVNVDNHLEYSEFDLKG